MNRRHFLRSSIAAVVTVAAAPFIPAPVVIPRRILYSRILVTPEMMFYGGGVGGGKTALLQAIYNEHRSLLQDVQNLAVR